MASFDLEEVFEVAARGDDDEGGEDAKAASQSGFPALFREQFGQLSALELYVQRTLRSDVAPGRIFLKSFEVLVDQALIFSDTWCEVVFVKVTIFRTKPNTRLLLGIVELCHAPVKNISL